ncbi:MAG: hypothetical protein A2091_00095 [Desulfuromonadales bacterium GWD2_61_12]|nr:MAG: hypothetical protein A2005_10995 [Desulfuromonadales bacterium GWC2_61_20]OGR36206.1 MAG: hypothetical protein A2091_00095 [Desulfuromonadales bacterium GWD2_61_12]HBT84078.1 hypothetical protein [Desulfuromonas sp.]
MTLRKVLVLTCLLLLPLVAAAAENVQTYIIQKGDTLSGLSERFLKDPYYWPSLWSNNPTITNPHFIYPGQEVRIYDGRIEIVPAVPEAPVASDAPIAAEPAEPAPTPAAQEMVPPVAAETPAAPQAVTVQTPGGEGFIAVDPERAVGTLVDTTDNRILIGEGDMVFLRLEEAPAVGDKFSVFEVSEKVRHPVTGKKFGYRIVDLGVVEVLSVHADVVTAVVRSAFREIYRDAMLLPYQKPLRDIAIKRAANPVSGYLLAAFSAKIVQGQGDVVYLDLGAMDGLEAGNLVDISRPRQATELADKSLALQLPEVVLGRAIVLDTRPHSATALILKVAGPVYVGDRVTAVTR